MDSWKTCKRILIIRADNLGDVIMSVPAIRAVRNSIGSRITLLTSTKGAAIAGLNSDIDEVLKFDVPWVKDNCTDAPEQMSGLIELLRNHHFDGCIIFTVYSQNSAAAAMVAYMAGIPLRLAYSRENLYGLLTHWIPDPEPLECIRHQVERDLALVATIGAFITQHNALLSIGPELKTRTGTKLGEIGIDINKPYIILHPGVSELKRRFPIENWLNCGKRLSDLDIPLLLTGSKQEREMLVTLQLAIGDHAYSSGGMLSVHEFAAAIASASVVVTVNTSTLHFASAFKTPVVALYAQTNPQHKPWDVANVVLEYSIPATSKSKNKIVEFVDKQLYAIHCSLPSEDRVFDAVKDLLGCVKA